MMLETRRKQGVVRGCIVPILTVAGLLLVCFFACFVLFNLNKANTGFSFMLPFLG